MIDLESMGVRYDAAIVSIGAVFFDERSLGEGFYTPVHLESCLGYGLTTDQSTIDWWAKQSADARSAWEDGTAPLMHDALKAFSDWVQRFCSINEVRAWGNGADFDLPILRSAFGKLDADPPFRYHNHRCFRTLSRLFPVDCARQGTHHHALDDAKHQARVVHAICDLHGLKLA